MKHRTLGRDGPTLHPVGIGAMSFSNFYGPTSEADSHAILDAARDAGVNHIDTSNIYGMGTSETVIGSYLAANRGALDHFFIATKGAIRRNPEGAGNIFDNSPAHLEAELDGSLKRLGVDAVDLYYVHRRDPAIPIEDVTGTLAEFVKQGKVKAIGFSEIAPTSLRRAHAVHPVAAVQSEYSLSTRAPELGLVQTCAELGVALVAFSPVGRSFLTDTPLTFEAAQTLPFLAGNPRFMQPNYDANIAAVGPFQALAAEMGLSAAGLAIAWVLAQGDHVLPIPGTRSVAHFAQLLEASDRRLSAADLRAIETVLPVGWAHGDRYSVPQWTGPERFC
ncbi:aldo/keto reductase [Sulfitobacter guttiformis]|uniref:Aryl-alcohol dehydrogenase-like predicted oxidoreductase n=1 Tax=Sulfitobacter guttiformis TaxID=74349 RepID=A0A420DMT1_9RHOB|nr:aldo/keto reductase [Sulfitobacter guttiformis]KIN72796.1 Aldo-keto reductase yakc [Sulfitobacter guttiformis KCTC 32187]RKE95488.1 aryl-alcohol dehydrogenase-like predicted oxidoreductase [Sulfitobacter guttiformis]